MSSHSPEQYLLAAVILRAVLDACNVHDAQCSPYERRKARKWFADRLEPPQPFSWRWTAEGAGLSAGTIERIEAAVTNGGPPNPELIGFLEEILPRGYLN